jgi:hypothetical protein
MRALGRAFVDNQERSKAGKEEHEGTKNMKRATELI